MYKQEIVKNLGFVVPDEYSIAVSFQQPDFLKILFVCLFNVH